MPLVIHHGIKNLKTKLMSIVLLHSNLKICGSFTKYYYKCNGIPQGKEKYLAENSSFRE